MTPRPLYPDHGSAVAPAWRITLVEPAPTANDLTLAAIRAQCEARHAVDGGWRVRRRIDLRGLHRAMTLGELADYVADTLCIGHEVVVKTDPLNAAMLIVWTRPAVPQAVGLDALREADDAGDALSYDDVLGDGADAIVAQDRAVGEAAA